MSIEEILTSGSIIIIVATFIQISPININPWSYIAKFLGREINEELFDEVKSIKSNLSVIEESIHNLREETEEANIIECRSRITRFNDELLENKKHTKDHFDQILLDITAYETYCRVHPDFSNDVTLETVNHIKRVYSKCQDEHSFL